jgi:hypothetical protein
MGAGFSCPGGGKGDNASEQQTTGFDQPGTGGGIIRLQCIMDTLMLRPEPEALAPENVNAAWD